MRDEPDVVAKSGDTGLLEATLAQADATPPDLTDCTVRLILAPMGGGDAVVVTGAVVSPATSGVVRWAPTDVDPGDYRGEWEVTNGADVQSYPNGGHLFVRVTGDLD